MQTAKAAINAVAANEYRSRVLLEIRAESDPPLPIVLYLRQGLLTNDVAKRALHITASETDNYLWLNNSRKRAKGMERYL